jgi:uncharacterized protein YkwD
MATRRVRLVSAGAAIVVTTAVAGCAELGLFGGRAGGSLPAGSVATDWTAPARGPHATTSTTPTARLAASSRPGHRAAKHPTSRPKATPTHASPSTKRPTVLPTSSPTARWTPTHRPAPRPIVTAVPAPKPTVTAAPAPKPTRTTAPAPKPSPTSSAGYTTRMDWANAVLAKLNAERAAHGLKALTMNTHLVSSAHTHNLAMARANQLSHQLSGEASLGARISTAGYRWTAAGENIAYNSNRSQAGVLALQDAMYGEQPPNDGHRRNILSSSFVHVGVDVIDDAVHHRVWLVTDFGRPL